MNFAHGELYMLGAYAGIVVVGLTHSFWVVLVVAPLAVGAIGAVTEVITLRPLYRREPLYGLILTFGLALDTGAADRKSTRLNSSHLGISYAVFCLKKKN